MQIETKSSPKVLSKVCRLRLFIQQCTILTDSQTTADKAAKLVNVTYNSEAAPVLYLDDGVTAKMFFPQAAEELLVGDPDREQSVDFKLSIT